MSAKRFIKREKTKYDYLLFDKPYVNKDIINLLCIIEENHLKKNSGKFLTYIGSFSITFSKQFINNSSFMMFYLFIRF